jgi:phosphoribosyl-ATP pyrophosphohydrolase
MKDPLLELFTVITDRRDRPKADSYTCKLFEGGDNKILKKIGEESAEVVMACKDDDADAISFITRWSQWRIIMSICN